MFLVQGANEALEVGICTQGIPDLIETDETDERPATGAIPLSLYMVSVTGSIAALFLAKF